jgi:SOS-response transcriptional repressor LexA
MTEAQQAVYDALIALTEANGQPPTVREIARVVERGVFTVHFHLARLRQQGRVTWDESRGRLGRTLRPL